MSIGEGGYISRGVENCIFAKESEVVLNIAWHYRASL
jgi:hypothetical protein